MTVPAVFVRALLVLVAAVLGGRSPIVRWGPRWGPPRGLPPDPDRVEPGSPVDGPRPWTWTRTFEGPTRIAAIRARFAGTTWGIPTRYRWEIRPCDAPGDGAYVPIADAANDPEPRAAGSAAWPRRRTWFVDATGCALRLVVTGTNRGTPALEDVTVVEGARDALEHAAVRAEGAASPLDHTPSYERPFVGAAGRGRWVLAFDLPRPEPIDRVRLVLGAHETIAPGPEGPSYAVARAPLDWSIFASEDGRTFRLVARAPHRQDGRALPVRRPLARLSRARPIVALRVVLDGATNEAGLPDSTSSPVVRAVSAHAVDDPRPVLPEPWILSVNANPDVTRAAGPGGAGANDAYFAKFLQKRFASLHAGIAADDRYARSLGARGERLDPAPSPSDGRALESIAGADPVLDATWLEASWPPPIVVLSGSNDWDYARRTTHGDDGRVRWNPLLDARDGGMGRLASAVRDRVAPFLGFCGGAQILALLEATRAGPRLDLDAILRRTTGKPIRGDAPEAALIRAWPGEDGPRHPVRFSTRDPLFGDLAAASSRSVTYALPSSHVDGIRPEAFHSRVGHGRTGAEGPLARLDVIATSAFCSPAVSASLHPVARELGEGRCARVVEAFRGRGAWPLVGAQFHPEQRDFAVAAPEDPPESVADARLFLAAVYEEIVDAYVTRTGPDAP